jgi:desulfoferrodoxin (superoxide reductase-like protein)
LAIYLSLLIWISSKRILMEVTFLSRRATVSSHIKIAGAIDKITIPDLKHFLTTPANQGAKHTPYLTFDQEAKTATVTVGSEDGEIHPMDGSADGVTEPHWISEVWIVDDQGYTTTLSSLDPTGVDHASLQFYPNSNSKSITAYIWCNIHGMYVGPTVDIPWKSDESDDTTENPGSSASGALASLGAMFTAALAAFVV